MRQARGHIIAGLPVILDDTAQRHEGQVFTLANGDMVLLCREAPPGRPPAARPAQGMALPDPATLPDTMARLLRVDLPDPARLTTVWRLEDALPAVTAFAAGRLADNRPGGGASAGLARPRAGGAARHGGRDRRDRRGLGHR